MAGRIDKWTIAEGMTCFVAGRDCPQEERKKENLVEGAAGRRRRSEVFQDDFLMMRMVPIMRVKTMTAAMRIGEMGIR
jgi:hypothetical protein